jgi:hypothetical protein
MQLGLSGVAMPAIKLTPATRVGVEAAVEKGLSFGAMWPGFAVAAMFAVSVGTIILSYSGSSPSTNDSLAVLPTAFEDAAISRHDHCCQAAAHQAKDVPQAPYPAIGQYLRNQLHHPVLAANLEADQWRFRGAAICPVGDVKAAHLVFARDDGETVSVFSLPANAFPQFQNNQT